MELVEQLLIGSKRIDAWRKEINAVIMLILPALSVKDREGLAQEVTLFETPHTKWTLHFPSTRDVLEDCPIVRFYSREGENGKELRAVLPQEQGHLHHTYVAQVHANLDNFVTGMKTRYPWLQQRLRPFYQAGGDGHILYEVRFHLPTGEMQTFRKKNHLKFPLPLGTEVFLSVEGEPVIGQVWQASYTTGNENEFFVVTGHSHGVTDEYGTIHEGNFVIKLEISPDSVVEHPENLIRLLEANGWEQQ